jgi:hypothetical protein
MIDKQLAAFLEEGLVIHLGTRNDRLEPSGVRVTAVVVDEDGVHVTAYVPAVAARRVLPDLHANGQAALVFVQPRDERGCQVKGLVEGVHDAGEPERAAVLAQWERTLDNLAIVGLPRIASATFVTWPCVAVRLRATALFSQTPGPGAGAVLAPAAMPLAAR